VPVSHDELPSTPTDCDVAALHRLKYSKHAASLPNNFVALGDAAVRLNPVNGQGMAKAAVEVIALDGALRRVRAGRGALPAKFAAKYFAHAAAITDRAWYVASARALVAIS
jgi:2-polyprenyl-6-methoxyphenol hydroxylase-like FAD-dependent oxidoreductase